MSPAHPLDPLTADEVCASPSAERAPPTSASDAPSASSRPDRSTPCPSQLESTPQRSSRSVPSSTSPSRSSRLQRGSFLRRSASLFRRAILLCPSPPRKISGGRPKVLISTLSEAGECTRLSWSSGEGNGRWGLSSSSSRASRRRYHLMSWKRYPRLPILSFDFIETDLHLKL